jgi:iron complex transport system substrate-binding protein
MNQNQKIILLILVVTISIVAVIGIYANNNYSDSNQKEHITDMVGRDVNMPAEINRVASLSYSTTVQLYMLAPDKMVGWDSNRTEAQNLYLPAKYKTLPTLGGGKKDANYETYISLDPDLVFVGHGGSADDVDRIQQKFGEIPLVDVEGDNNITNITASIKFMGSILGEQGKANELINFYTKVMGQVNSTAANIPESGKKRVYYARDSTGLMTNPAGSSHTQLIELCGGINVAQVPITKGSVEISMEQLLKWNPDVIIASDPVFYKEVYSDPVWQNVKAVKDKQVYLVPSSPFNWFESPPGVNVILGIPWTAKVLYPEKFKDIDLKNLTKEFYSDFYHYNLTDKEVSDILSSSRLKEF